MWNALEHEVVFSMFKKRAKLDKLNEKAWKSKIKSKKSK